MKISIYAMSLLKNRTMLSPVTIKVLLNCFLLLVVLSVKAQKENPFGNPLIPDMFTDASI